MRWKGDSYSPLYPQHPARWPPLAECAEAPDNVWVCELGGCWPPGMFVRWNAESA